MYHCLDSYGTYFPTCERQLQNETLMPKGSFISMKDILVLVNDCYLTKSLKPSGFQK